MTTTFSFRPTLVSLEGREVPALLAPPPPFEVAQVGAPSAAAKSTIGTRMAEFLASKLGTRLGGGECAHLATEALRVAGGDFTLAPDVGGKGTGDYDWGAQVARLTNGSQLAGKKFQVGDIIQYQNARFSGGGTSKLAHHTQVVAAVNSSGRITHVYECNITSNGVTNRNVQKRAVPDLSKLTGGSVTIYRAEPRQSAAGLIEFTVVNNAGSSQSYVLKSGTWTSATNTLTSANTAGSFQYSYITGAKTATLVVGGKSITLTHGGGYEIYRSGNSIALRRL